MIKVNWPIMGDIGDDSEVLNWLEELISDHPREEIFQIRNATELYFAREDDAIAFKLRFGL